MRVACRQKMPKTSLIRAVRTPEGNIMLDFTGKAAGRGAYLCDNADCVKKLSRGKLLGKVFKVPVPDEIYREMERAYEGRKQGS